MDCRFKYGDEWVDVKPVSGNLVVNVGDIFQVNSHSTWYIICIENCCAFVVYDNISCI